MDYNNFDNSFHSAEPENQQDYFQSEQYPAQSQQYRYPPQQVAPAVVPKGKKKAKIRDMDSVIIAILLVVVVIAVFFAVRAAKKGTSVFEVTIPSISVSTDAYTQPASTESAVSDTQPVQSATTEALQTDAPVTDAVTQVPDTSAQQESTQVSSSVAATSQPVSSEPSKEEILKAVSDGINSLKDPSASFKGTKTQKIYIQLTECSVPALVAPANTVLDYFAGEEVFEFDFSNGKATDPETGEEIAGVTAIPPTDKPFALTVEGVADAKYEQSGDKKIYTITVVAESSNLASPRPPHHNAACDTLDFSAFELPMGEITKADFEYPGAVITVTIDSDGKIVEYHENLPTKGVGEGKLGITASGSMEGYIDEKWVIEWK